ncbi:MAG: antibiotic biosynthesis monooxygenase family protein [Bacteriovoracaceae bacterium]|nr:antibiotic biosynthesis monooxygenase [Bacteroidota bacterium]
MKSPVFEVVVYKVKEEQLSKFLEQQPMAHAVVKNFPGFTSLHTLRSTDSPATFVDYCEWESLEAAQNANQLAMHMPELQIFFELGDGMISFGHYTSKLLTLHGGSAQ